MRFFVLPGVCVALAFSLSSLTVLAQQGCEPDGNVRFLCGHPQPEDFAYVPDTEWLLVSRYSGGVPEIRLLSVKSYATSTAFPSSPARIRLDSKMYSTCPGPIDLTENERPRTHGLYLRPGRNSVHTLYVTHHGNRESVEVFEVDRRAKPPTVTWIGCVVAPEKASLNSVVGLPDRGFAATNIAGGEVLEWHPGKGWAQVPGSETPRPNGLEVSKDGRWLYIAGFGTQTFIRLSRGQTLVKKDSVPIGHNVDNLRLAPDGWVYATGGTVSRAGGPDGPPGRMIVNRIHPETLEVQELWNHPTSVTFFGNSVAIPVGKEIWVGSFRADRIARVPLPAPSK